MEWTCLFHQPINLVICLLTQTSFESTPGKLECGQLCFTILNIYRPSGPTTTFFSELQDTLSYISILSHDPVLMGDFNLYNNFTSSDARQLTCTLESLDLHQYVDLPTHIHGHAFNVMISSTGCNDP